jgi:hypothetical protein
LRVIVLTATFRVRDLARVLNQTATLSVRQSSRHAFGNWECWPEFVPNFVGCKPWFHARYFAYRRVNV